MENGEKIKAHSENLNSHDTTLIRVNNNTYISPKIINCDGEYLESTEKLRNWLFQRGITEKQLDEISKVFNIYEDITYYGVSTPEYSMYRDKISWAYSSEPLVLKEQEIESVLNSIDDILLREKIKCILYARVFKKR